MKYIAPAISFLFALFGVAFIVGLALVMIFPPEGIAVVGIGLDWRNLPGTLLGIWAGIHGWKASMRSAQKKNAAVLVKDGHA